MDEVKVNKLQFRLLHEICDQKLSQQHKWRPNFKGQTGNRTVIHHFPQIQQGLSILVPTLLPALDGKMHFSKAPSGLNQR